MEGGNITPAGKNVGKRFGRPLAIAGVILGVLGIALVASNIGGFDDASNTISNFGALMLGGGILMTVVGSLIWFLV